MKPGATRKPAARGASASGGRAGQALRAWQTQVRALRPAPTGPPALLETSGRNGTPGTGPRTRGAT